MSGSTAGPIATWLRAQATQMTRTLRERAMPPPLAAGSRREVSG